MAVARTRASRGESGKGMESAAACGNERYLHLSTGGIHDMNQPMWNLIEQSKVSCMTVNN